MQRPRRESLKIAVFTYNRYDSITTAQALEDAGADFDVVCHDENAAALFRRAGRVNQFRLRVSGAAKGLANNRNWYLENKVDDGEWVLMLCDDYLHTMEFDAYDTWPKSFLPIDTTITTHWNRRLRKKVSMATFLRRAEDVRKMCEWCDVSLGGFAGFDNPLFRKHKWKLNVLVDGRAMVVKKTALRFDPCAQMVDDVAFSALNIEAGNGTLVNQWVLPDFSRYTKGSYGSIADRLVQRRAECAYLTQRFPGLVVTAKKPGWPDGTHIKIRWMNAKSLGIWRKKNSLTGAERFLKNSLPFELKKAK